MGKFYVFCRIKLKFRFSLHKEVIKKVIANKAFNKLIRNERLAIICQNYDDFIVLKKKNCVLGGGGFI